MRIVFMGTPEFAVCSLKALADSSHEVVAVYTQVPKPAGRGMQLQLSPVQKFAEELNIPVFSPLNFKDQAVCDQVASFKPDFLVVVAYGKILPKEVLSIPKFAAINVHGSVLPAWRGAAPVERSVIAGDYDNVGVCTMVMDEDMDTGDVLLVQKVDVNMSMSMAKFKMVLAELGVKLLVETLDNFEDIEPRKQDNQLATFANKITNDDYLLDWNKPAGELCRQVYAFSPKCFFNHKNDMIKVLSAKVIDEQSSSSQIGSIVSLKPFIVQCNSGLLEIIELQKPGKKSVHAKDFLNGYKLNIGNVLV